MFSEGSVHSLHISHLYSGSVHTFVNTAGVTVVVAAHILPASSGKVGGNGGT
jgi:hypothetical protein